MLFSKYNLYLAPYIESVPLTVLDDDVIEKVVVEKGGSVCDPILVIGLLPDGGGLALVVMTKVLILVVNYILVNYISCLLNIFDEKRLSDSPLRILSFRSGQPDCLLRIPLT